MKIGDKISVCRTKWEEQITTQNGVPIAKTPIASSIELIQGELTAFEQGGLILDGKIFIPYTSFDYAKIIEIVEPKRTV